MWNIAVCDDVMDNAKLLKQCIQKIGLRYGGIGEISVYTDGFNLLEDLDDPRDYTGIVFMDIDLGIANGIDIAAKIKEKKPDCQIIFVSSFDDYIEDIYDVEHIYYIKKPVNERTVGRALTKAKEKLREKMEDRLYIKNRSGIYVIPFKEIYTLEKDRRKINVRTNSEEICNFYGKFADVEEQLNYRFIRCHNSFVVNAENVRSFENEYFIMMDGRKIPISRTYVKEARRRFNKYVNERMSI